jgi:hypothetical protein
MQMSISVLGDCCTQFAICSRTCWLQLFGKAGKNGRGFERKNNVVHHKLPEQKQQPENKTNERCPLFELERMVCLWYGMF